MNRNDKVDMMIDAIRISKVSEKGARSIAEGLVKLTRLGREMHSYAERLCNYGERAEGEYSRKTDSISRRAYQVIADDFGLAPAQVRLELSGDPRGACLKMFIDAWTFYF